MQPINLNYLHSSVLLKQLAACGCRRVVISPGSRSTPLALVAASMPEFATYVLTDERSAAFFALGLSKADGVPAILICTSGTAAANYFPAVIEASQSLVPLILLTADRPASLRNIGAPQTINQVNLYGEYPRFFADLLAPVASLEDCCVIRSVASKAYTKSAACPAGPVHVNVPLDEPLVPIAQDEEKIRAVWTELTREPWQASGIPAPIAASRETIESVAATLNEALFGLIICGPASARTLGEAEALYYLGKKLGWPVLADVASGVRFFSTPVQPYYDVFLRDESLAMLEPDVVLAFGAYPTSKVLNSYLNRHRAAHTIRVQPHRIVQDPDSRASETIHSDVEPFVKSVAPLVAAARDSLLYESFRAASLCIRGRMQKSEHGGVCEARFVQEALRFLPDGSNLVLANSMPIRYAEALATSGERRPQVFVMRGANGIDGTISHAAGIATASEKPTLLITGDLAFLHDLNGLAAVKKYAPNLTVLLLNNNGGGIFHFLPVHEQLEPEQFELLHGTPHGLDLSLLRDLFDVDWHRVEHPDDIGNHFSHSGRPRVIEVQTDRDQNQAEYSEWMEYLVKEVASL